MSLQLARKKLRRIASKKKARTLRSFFKTKPGQYAAGDVFIGVTVPAIRRIARDAHSLSLSDIGTLLHSRIHEERLLALIILVARYERGDSKTQKEIFTFYLAHSRKVNNWDLVDLSAPKIVGDYLFKRKRDVLHRLIRSGNLWDRRIALVSTHSFIKRNDIRETLRLSRLVLRDSEDLIHKAAGWMLREAGKVNMCALEDFLERHAGRMPRTMLRYALEKSSPAKRKYFMQKK